MRLTKAQRAAAAVCEPCFDGDNLEDSLIVERQRGWIHVENHKMRCPGQEDDDTDDRATPMTDHTGKVLTAAKIADMEGIPL